MRDSKDLVRIVQKISGNASEAGKPANVFFGTVVSPEPELKIKVEQKITLNKNQLILTRNVTEYWIEMTVDHKTEERSGGGGEASFSSHNHDYKGRKKFKVHNQLKVDEKVLLIREKGGQRFVVIDRVVKS